MSRTNVLIAAALLAALFLVQRFGLEPSREQVLERASQNVGELTAPNLLPTYIGSLFLGSFRAIAIDVLWIQMSRMRQQEHRYFETVEIMDLITKLQPRNPEAWAYMASDAAYNIANQFRTQPDERERRRLKRLIASPGVSPELVRAAAAQIEVLKKRIDENRPQYRLWVRLGLEKLLEGTRNLPDDPYLKAQIGQTLLGKAVISSGEFESEFLEIVESDRDLQGMLAGPAGSGESRSAFELAEIWFGRTAENLRVLAQERRFRFYRHLAEQLRRSNEEQNRDHHTTQVGLNIHPANVEGFRYRCQYLEAIRLWYEARGAGEKRAFLLLRAEAAFRKAADRGVAIRRAYPIPIASAIFDDYVPFCRRMAQVVEEQRAMSTEDPGRLLGLLVNVREELIRMGVPNLDDQFVVGYMGGLKRSLGGDAQEFNDDRHTAQRLYTGEGTYGDIGPDLSDEDWFEVYVPAPAGNDGHGHAHEGAPSVTQPVALEIERQGDLPLTVRSYAMRGRELKEVGSFLVADDRIVPFKIDAEREGWVFVQVSASRDSADHSRRGYRIKSLGVQP